MNRAGSTSTDCMALGPLLVDYADAATSAADAARVERHVAACAACRTELMALRRSLCVLESIWAEVGGASAECSLSRTTDATPAVQFTRELPADTRFQASLGGREAYRWRFAAAVGGVAAAVVLAVGVYRAVRTADAPESAVANADDDPAGDAQVAAKDAQWDMDNLDIDAFIRRNEQSARLTASVEILTSLPVEREDAERAQRYLRDAYGVEHTGTTSGQSGEL